MTGVSPLVRVTIVSDRRLVYATTGEQVGGSGLTKTFEARNVRDFAFTAAPDYRLQSATVNGVVDPRLGPARVPVVDACCRPRSGR